MLAAAALLAACRAVPAAPAPVSPTLTATARPSGRATAPATVTATAAVTLTPRLPPTATVPPASAVPAIRLLFTGDINPGRCPAQIALAHDDFTGPYRVVGEALRAADITVGSLDGSLSGLSPPGPCPQTMNLIGPARTVEGLAYAGFDVITVATNHARDCGQRGWGCGGAALADTLANLSAAGIAPVGGGDTLAGALQPAIVERQGVRFAFIGVTAVGPETWVSEAAAGPGTAPLSGDSLPRVLASVSAARASAEVVVVLAQWGEEYTEQPTAEQRRWAAALVDAGATLVIGNHPHLVQPVEAFPAGQGGGAPNAVAAYALGNFVFDQGPWRTRQGVLFEATFAGAELVSWQLLPIHIRSLYQPHWAEPAEATAVLERIAALSTALPTRQP